MLLYFIFIQILFSFHTMTILFSQHLDFLVEINGILHQFYKWGHPKLRFWFQRIWCNRLESIQSCVPWFHIQGQWTQHSATDSRSEKVIWPDGRPLCTIRGIAKLITAFVKFITAFVKFIVAFVKFITTFVKCICH